MEYVRFENRELELNTGLVEFWNHCYYSYSKRATSVTVTGYRFNTNDINHLKTSIGIEAYLPLSDWKNRVQQMSIHL